MNQWVSVLPSAGNSSNSSSSSSNPRSIFFSVFFGSAIVLIHCLFKTYAICMPKCVMLQWDLYPSQGRLPIWYFNEGAQTRAFYKRKLCNAGIGLGCNTNTTLDSLYFWCSQKEPKVKQCLENASSLKML